MSGVIYYDFTSAEAFVLHELVVTTPDARDWSWRGVQVDSTLAVPMTPFDRRSRERVEAEVADALRAWPGGRVATPGGRPNTRAALQAVAAVDRVHPVRGEAFRTGLFRAYWWNGRDLSDRTVILEVATTAGVPPWVDLEQQASQAVQVGWELEWKAERLGGVPRLIRGDGQILWRVADARATREFLQGG